jgi:hypothetical protein
METEKTMLYPEMMHSVVYQHQEYLRSLWNAEPLVPGAGDLLRSARKYLGAAFVRIGILLGGNAPKVATASDLSPQQ